MGNSKAGWYIIGGVVFALVIIPFLIWGDRIDAWTAAFVSSAGRNFLLVALVLGGLLAFDIILPVPSSIVSTSCGLLLGFFPGLLVSFGGMVISCGVGYWIGFMMGRPAAGRLVGEDGLDRFGRISDRYGIWAIVIARPVPVLAEISVLFAGMGGISPARFLVITSVSNLGISAAYAAIGAYAADVNSFLLAFAGATCVPGILLILFKRFNAGTSV